MVSGGEESREQGAAVNDEILANLERLRELFNKQAMPEGERWLWAQDGRLIRFYVKDGKVTDVEEFTDNSQKLRGDKVDCFWVDENIPSNPNRLPKKLRRKVGKAVRAHQKANR